jgi:ubiquinone biosynthesis accessory factor UbiJ
MMRGPVTATVMSIDSIVSKTVAAAFNRVLKAEPWATAQLAAHAGKQFAVELVPFSLRFNIAADGLLSGAEIDPLELPSVTLRLAAAALFADATDRLKHVRIEGEVALAQTLGEVAQKVRPDPEQALSEVVGDVAARRISQIFQTALDALRTQGNRATAATVQRIAHDDPLILARPPFAELSAENQALRDQIERLAKRLDALERM